MATLKASQSRRPAPSVSGNAPAQQRRSKNAARNAAPSPRTTLWLALAGSLLMWVALPPVDFWPLAWVAPVCWLVLAMLPTMPGRHPYRVLWLAGFLFWMGVLHWLRLPHWATSFGWVALSAYLAFYIPAFVALVRVAVWRLGISIVITAPVVWTGLELVRGHLLGGFTMGSLGHTQYRWLEVIQIADLAGAYGVSFVVMFVAACVARMLPLAGARFAAWPLVPAVVTLALVLAYGAWRMDQVSTRPGPSVALIQGSIDSEMKHDPALREQIFRDYFRLSRDARRQRGDLDLIVWPETMFRDPLITHTDDARLEPGIEWNREALHQAAKETRLRIGQTAMALKTPLVLGVDVQHYGPGTLERYNTAVLVTPDGELVDRYDKMHRVMFGEYIPLANYVPWLYRLTPLPGGIEPGAIVTAFEAGEARLAPNICYETVLPQFIRRQVEELRRRGEEPDVLVNLTNSGWYWGSSELDLHLMCNVMRAVECRKPLLVAANTGISAWIDGDGRIRAQGPRRAEAVLIADVKLDDRQSWYARYGDWLAGTCLLLTVGIAVVGTGDIVQRRRHRAAQ